MTKLRNLIFLLLISLHLFSQSRNDNWIFGFADTLYKENCGKALWNTKNGQDEFKIINTELNFESTNAAISDTNGNLLLFTNGCAISDFRYKIIENGSDINPGKLHDLTCGDYGYTVPNGAMFLPIDSNRFILLHLGAKDDNNTGNYGPFYYSIIENKYQNFKVIEKNIIIKKDSIESFSVIKHSNGKDWWIIVPKYHTNKYYRFLLSGNKIEEKTLQITSLTLPNDFCKISGLSGFSPDGKKFLRYNRSCGYLLFDFDRCTGLLSNGIFESVGYFVDDISSDFIFSPDSKFLYITKLNHHKYTSVIFKNKIYKIFLDQLGVKAEPYIKLDLGNDMRLGRFFSNSDSSLYVLNAYSSDVLHSIESGNNNESFLSPNSFPLPVLNAQSIPYFANFSLDKLNCEETNTKTIQKQNTIPISFSPNPFHDLIYIKTNGNHFKYKLKLLNMQGKLVYNYNTDFSGNTKIIIPSLEQGIYILEFIIKDKTYFLKAIKL